MIKKLLVAGFVVSGILFSGSVLRAEPLEVGAAAPKVKATGDDGKTVDLGAAFEKGTVFVFFYPKANTGGCTAQACSVRDAYEVISDLGIVVYGVSMDSVEDQKAFKDEHQLPYTLIADTDGKVVDAFGVPRRGRFPSRQAFLIEDGVVVWRDLKASTRRQADDVLAAVNARQEKPAAAPMMD